MPCTWSVNVICCNTWDTYSPEIQAAAADYATTVLWASTGRQYGLCPVTVRPCAPRKCLDGGLEWWGWQWGGSSWTPYIFNGTWYNCGCSGPCSCEPRCQVSLMGPVNSIIEVTIGGIVVPASSYRVDNEQWLVRTDGECWPECPDMDSDDGPNVFKVTYVRGVPVPTVLLTGAGTLACEWAKACTNDETCRLSGRVQSMARNGVTIDIIDPNMLLEQGLTGLPEVDVLIRALNPYNLKQRLRVYAPELNVPRMVTSP